MMKDTPKFLLVRSTNLTLRETEILQKVKEGFTCKEISDCLGISLETVKSHRKKIVSKLGLKGKIEFRRFIYELLLEELENQK